MTELQGYEYFKDDYGSTKALQVSTGEVTETVWMCLPIGSQIRTPEAITAQNEYLKLKEQNELRRLANNDLGKFFFISNEEDFKDLAPQTVTRLIYLNTYTHFGDNKLMLTERTPMKRKDLANILGISKAAITKFWKEVHPKYIQEQDDGLIFTNTDIFIKRKLNQRGKYNPYQKFYINGIRTLYKSTGVSNHKHLGYIFKMLPFINMEYNVLCKNPMEKDSEKIELLSVSEFCNIIDYNISQLNRLLKIYNNIKFNVMIDQINLNADSINDTLITTADSVGYTMSDNMQKIWDGSTNALDGVITKYGDKFDLQFTAVNAVLNSISVAVASMVSASDKKAAETVKNTTTTTTPSKPASTPKPSTTPKPSKPAEKKVTVGGKINAKGAKIYSDSYGGGKQNQYFSSDPIYTVLGENNGYWKVRYHKLSSGVTGWFKKGDVKAYKTGGLVDYTGLAQVDGTPGKPELMLNSDDTKNFIGLRDALRAMASQPLTMGNTQNFDESYKKYIPEIVGITDVKNRVSDLSNPSLTQNISFGDINIPIDHVDDYNDLMRKIQRDKKFEEMIMKMTIDRLGGGSPLDKYHVRWN